jgi:hypothetical protein
LSKAQDSNDIQFSANGQWTALRHKEDKRSADDSAVIETIPGIALSSQLLTVESYLNGAGNEGRC